MAPLLYAQRAIGDIYWLCRRRTAPIRERARADGVISASHRYVSRRACRHHFSIRADFGFFYSPIEGDGLLYLSATRYGDN